MQVVAHCPLTVLFWSKYQNTTNAQQTLSHISIKKNIVSYPFGSLEKRFYPGEKRGLRFNKMLKVQYM